MLVDGARQVGKTYLVEKFAQREYHSYVKVDFLLDDALAQSLSGTGSAQEIIEAIGITKGKRLVPGETLVFFDEVQQSPDIVALSKYLVQDGRIDVAMSGSLLVIEMRKLIPVALLSASRPATLTALSPCRNRV